jgi:hypothetical protein
MWRRKTGSQSSSAITCWRSFSSAQTVARGQIECKQSVTNFSDNRDGPGHPLSSAVPLLAPFAVQLGRDAPKRLDLGRERVLRIMEGGIDEEKQRPALVVGEVEFRCKVRRRSRCRRASRLVPVPVRAPTTVHHSLHGRASGHVSQRPGAAALLVRQVARNSHSSAKSCISAASLGGSVFAIRRAVSPRLAHRLARGTRFSASKRCSRGLTAGLL